MVSYVFLLSDVLVVFSFLEVIVFWEGFFGDEVETFVCEVGKVCVQGMSH